jgi:hypothetical protein
LELPEVATEDDEEEFTLDEDETVFEELEEGGFGASEEEDDTAAETELEESSVSLEGHATTTSPNMPQTSLSISRQSLSVWHQTTEDEEDDPSTGVPSPVEEDDSVTGHLDTMLAKSCSTSTMQSALTSCWHLPLASSQYTKFFVPPP